MYSGHISFRNCRHLQKVNYISSSDLIGVPVFVTQIFHGTRIAFFIERQTIDYAAYPWVEQLLKVRKLSYRRHALVMNHRSELALKPHPVDGCAIEARNR